MEHEELPEAEKFQELFAGLEKGEGFDTMDSVLTSFGGGFLSIMLMFLLFLLRSKLCKKSDCDVSGCHVSLKRETETLREIIAELKTAKNEEEKEKSTVSAIAAPPR